MSNEQRHGEHVDMNFAYSVFPQLDALHVLDASAHFDAWWSGRNAL